MKIVLLIAHITKPGGTERAVANIANDLSEKGYSVMIASIFTVCGNSFYSLHKDIYVIHLGVTFQQSLPKRVLLGFRELYSKMKALYQAAKGNIFIATDPFVSFVMARLHHPEDKNKLIVCEHMALSISKSYSVWFRKMFLKKVTAFVVLTERDKEFLQEILPGSPCYVIPNRISFYPETLADCDKPVILSIGRLVPQKNYGELITICMPVLHQYKDWKLIIVGEGEQKAELLQQIQTAKLEDRILLKSPTHNVSNYFHGSGIYAMSSIYEGFPMVLLEAKSYGLPLVSFDCPNGPKEMIKDGEDGFLIPMHDKELFGKKLETLIQNVSLRKKFGKQGSSDVQKRYSKAKIVEKWEQLLGNL